MKRHEVATITVPIGVTAKAQPRIREFVSESAVHGELFACAVDGIVPRFMNIWPYKRLDDRQKARTAAVAASIWPPKCGPEHLATLQPVFFCRRISRRYISRIDWRRRQPR